MAQRELIVAAVCQTCAAQRYVTQHDHPRCRACVLAGTRPGGRILTVSVVAVTVFALCAYDGRSSFRINNDLPDTTTIYERLEDAKKAADAKTNDSKDRKKGGWVYEPVPVKMLIVGDTLHVLPAATVTFVEAQQ
jgi:hypothetical protein